MHRSSDELLQQIKTEGKRRRVRRQRRYAALGVVGGALVLALPLSILATGDDGGEKVDVLAADESGDESDREAPATTVVTVRDDEATTDATGGGETSTTTGADIPPVGPSTTIPTTTTTVPCRNSTEPRCGPFRWDPTPKANSPVLVSVAVSDPTPEVGQQVTYTVTWNDPDAELLSSDSTTDDGVLIGATCGQEQKYGPWTPPAARAGSGTVTFTRTYTQAGPASEMFLVATGSGQCDDPYASEMTANTTVQVGASTTEPGY